MKNNATVQNEVDVIPHDYHDYIYRFIYFLLKPLAPHIPKSVTPNQITVLGFVFAMMGNAALFFIHTNAAYLYWTLFNFLWFLTDALDGMHARLSNQSSEFGAFLDHALDNIYFLFMLTAFVARFDLMHLLYIYIVILRLTAAVTVFTVQCHTGRLYLSRFSGGLETVLFSTAMILSYYYPNASVTIPILSFLHLSSGVFMKCALLVYFIGVPLSVVQQFRFVQTILLPKQN